VKTFLDKVLVVEDSKSIRLAMKASLESFCDLEVLTAKTFQEAEVILSTHGSTLFLAVLDLALPDAMHGEIVDYAAALEVPFLVFTTTFDAKLRKTILSKGAIDYVIKGHRSVEEVVGIIRRLQRNRQVRLLIVDDSRSAREDMHSSLEGFMFQVVTVENGIEAIEVLRGEGNIDLMLTDYEMPFMNGLELTTEVRKRFGKEELGIIGVSSTQDDTLAARFIKIGANDFIRKPLGPEEFCHRILHHVETIEHVRRTRKVVGCLEESERRERTLLEHAPLGIFRSTPQGRFLFANTWLAHMYGYDSPEDLVGSIHNIGAQLYVDQAEREMVQKKLEQGPLERMEVRRRRKDGSVIWVALSMLAVLDQEGVVHYEGFVRDITERRQAEITLRESNDFQHLVMNSIDVGVMVINAQSHTVEVANNEAAKMIGMPVEDIIGQVCHKLLCPAEFGGCPITDLGQVVDHAEKILLRADGESLHILKSVKRFTSRGVEKLLETFVDISERKKAEAMRDHIERIIHHDLRTPVSSALNVSKLLHDDGNLTSDQLQLLDALESASHRMLDVLNSSLDIYKIETRQYKVQPEILDCAELIRNIIQEFAFYSKFEDLRIEFLCEGAPVRSDSRCICLGQKNLLQTVMQNLLQNALEASPKDAPVVVELSAGEGVLIKVINSGSVPSEIRKNFFDKYVTSGKFKGTGLGTYSARLIVQAMDGDIAMYTSDNENKTIITIRLPSADICKHHVGLDPISE
jgi:PAS domain S-box-containing protein